VIDELWLLLGQVGVLVVLGGVGAVAFRRDFHLGWFLAALLLYVVYDALLTRGFFLLPGFPPDAQWNWLGKALALAGMLGVAALPRFGYGRSGLTLKQKPGSWAAVVALLILSAVAFYFAIADADGPADGETIAFQWTMPGLDEEAFYRGVLLLAMNEAFRARASILGAPIGFGGVLTAVLFGLAHAMGFEAGGYSFDLATFALTGVPSLILLWMRERTGSVLLPIVAHNVANGAFTIV
jgi:uncharacterized protein